MKEKIDIIRCEQGANLKDPFSETSYVLNNGKVVICRIPKTFLQSVPSKYRSDFRMCIEVSLIQGQVSIRAIKEFKSLRPYLWSLKYTKWFRCNSEIILKEIKKRAK